MQAIITTLLLYQSLNLLKLEIDYSVQPEVQEYVFSLLLSRLEQFDLKCFSWEVFINSLLANVGSNKSNNQR